MRGITRHARFVSIFIASMFLTATQQQAFAAPKLSTSDPNYIPTESEIEAILLEQYRKKLKNEILYYKGKKLSQIDKALGIKPSLPSPAPAPPGGASPLPPTSCSSVAEPILIRRNRLDTFQLREEQVPLSAAKGASISVTRDNVADTTTAAVNGRVQGIFYRLDPLNPCVNGKVGDPFTPMDFSKPHYGFVVAPFADAQGTETFPFKKTDKSNLQAGVDFQLSIFGGLVFDHQYVIATPYYQTDFRGSASVGGFQAAWEPVATDFRLGGYIGVPNPYVDWFWQLRVVADSKNVMNIGATGLTKGRYDWVGTTVQVHFLFFPGRSAVEPDWISPALASLVDKLFANVTLNSFVEARTGMSATWYEFEFGYNITPDGKSSVSLKYDGGKDKDTLIQTKKYLLSLNYKL